MTKIRAALLLMVVLALALPAPPVGAEPLVAAIKLTPVVGPPTTKVAVKGKGFAPNEGITLSFDDAVVGQATADGTGTFSKAITIPAGARRGRHTVTATGATSQLATQAAFKVTA